MRETKSTKSSNQTEGRVITGICSVFGNVDDWGDRMHPGAFTKTLSEGRDRVRHMWNHSFSEPPIAKVLEVREVGREELPAEILQYAPNATGGLLVKREYLDDPESDRIYKGILAGTITEMSFGFDATKFDFTEENEKTIREVREVRLYDTSDVNWGMNNATLASKSAYSGMSREMVLGYLPSILKELQTEFKTGRTISAANMEKLASIHQTLRDMGFDRCVDKTDEKSLPIEAEAGPTTSLYKAQALLESIKLGATL